MELFSSAAVVPHVGIAATHSALVILKTSSTAIDLVWY